MRLWEQLEGIRRITWARAAGLRDRYRRGPASTEEDTKIGARRPPGLRVTGYAKTAVTAHATRAAIPPTADRLVADELVGDGVLAAATDTVGVMPVAAAMAELIEDVDLSAFWALARAAALVPAGMVAEVATAVCPTSRRRRREELDDDEQVMVEMPALVFR